MSTVKAIASATVVTITTVTRSVRAGNTHTHTHTHSWLSGSGVCELKFPDHMTALSVSIETLCVGSCSAPTFRWWRCSASSRPSSARRSQEENVTESTSCWGQTSPTQAWWTKGPSVETTRWGGGGLKETEEDHVVDAHFFFCGFQVCMNFECRVADVLNYDCDVENKCHGHGVRHAHPSVSLSVCQVYHFIWHSPVCLSVSGV